MVESTQGGVVHLSKGIVETWQRCPLAYRFERVDRQTIQRRHPRQALGIAAHEAVAEALRKQLNPEDPGFERRIGHVLDAHGVDRAELPNGQEWVMTALWLIADRGGRVRWIEHLVEMHRTPGLVVWGKFDVGVAGGSLAPLEVLDWKFGTSATPPSAVGTKVYRLLAGHADPNRLRRPIAITEVHVPSGRETTVVPNDEHVGAWWLEVKTIADEIRAARTSGEFVAKPGPWCRWCDFRAVCPEAQSPAGSQ